MIKVAAITGYKPHELGIFKNDHPGVEYIKRAIKKVLLPLLEEGLEWILVSGQLGVELWAAELVLELQMEFPDLKLAVITPFLGQEENWKEETKEFYEFIVSQADFLDSVTRKKYESPAQFKLKNAFFVEKTDALIILYDEEKQGSPQYILREAEKKEGYEIFTINSYDLQAIVEEEQWKSADLWSE